MESTLFTFILVIVLVYMLFKCRKGGGCCNSGSKEHNDFDEIQSNLERIEKENCDLKRKIEEMK